jgi:hypothetical protein
MSYSVGGRPSAMFFGYVNVTLSMVMIFLPLLVTYDTFGVVGTALQETTGVFHASSL